MKSASSFREIDCDGTTTVDLMALVGRPATFVQLLATGTGSLTLTPSSPIAGSATESVLITSAAVGARWDVTITAIKGPSGVKVLVGWSE